MISKFKRTLNPTIIPDGVKQTTNHRLAQRAGGNLLVAFSGGLGSTVLLDMVSRCYFQSNPEEGLNPHGGRNHPNNGKVWKQAAVAYVEICGAFPGVIHFYFGVGFDLADDRLFLKKDEG